MNSVHTLAPEFVDTFPAAMAPGVLYVCLTYRTTGHLCCCGCGQEVIAALAPAQWSMTYDGETVSMHPSIGNWALKCQSHYVIRRNQILWRRRFTPEEISDNRAADRAALERYDADTTSGTDAGQDSPGIGRSHLGPAGPSLLQLAPRHPDGNLYCNNNLSPERTFPMNAEDVALFLLFSACAVGFGAAAKKYGARVGIPPVLVPLIGAALLAAIDPPGLR